MAEIVYPPVVALARVAMRAWALDIQVRGKENLPATGGAVLAINHVSYVDFIFAGLAGQHTSPHRLVRFMAKDELFRHRIAGPLMRGMHHLPVDRSAGAAAYAAAVGALRGGELVGVFPEATISRSFEIKEFKSGAVRMAVEADVPIIPVVLWGTQRLLTKGRPRQLHRRGVAISVTIGEPIRPNSAGPEAVAELRSAMTDLVATARNRYPQSPAGADDTWWLPRAAGGTAPTPQEAAALDAAEAEQRRQRREARAAGR